MVGASVQRFGRARGRQSARGRERVQAIRRGDCVQDVRSTLHAAASFHHRPQRRGQDVAPEHDLGFLQADSGRIVLEGRDITQKKPSDIAAARIARDFQTSPCSAVSPSSTISCSAATCA